MVACGVPEAEQKILGFPANSNLPLSRLQLKNNQQILLYRVKSYSDNTMRGQMLDESDEEGSIWLNLPSEVQYLVFGLLDPASLVSCSRVSKHWRDIAVDDWIWEAKCHSTWQTLLPLKLPFSHFPWRSFYFEHLRLQRNWIRNNVKVRFFTGAPAEAGKRKKTAMAFSDMSCLDYQPSGYRQLCLESTSSPEGVFESTWDELFSKYEKDRSDAMFAAGSFSGRIIIGNIWQNEMRKTLVGHTQPVKDLCFAGHRHLLSADASGHVYLWDIYRSTSALPWADTSPEYVGRRNMNVGALSRLLLLSTQRLVVASEDGSVGMLDLAKSLHPMAMSRRNHENKITSLSSNLFEPNLFATSGDDGFVKIWDTRIGEAAMSMYVDKEGCQQVQFGWNHQLLSSGPCGLSFWDYRMYASNLTSMSANRMAQLPFPEISTFHYDGARLAIVSDAQLYLIPLGGFAMPLQDDEEPVVQDQKTNSLFYHSHIPDSHPTLMKSISSRATTLPLPEVTGKLFLDPSNSNLVCLSSHKVTGLDISSKYYARNLDTTHHIFEGDF